MNNDISSRTTKKNKKKIAWRPTIIAIIILSLAITILVLIFNNGNTTTTVSKTENSTTNSTLICVAEDRLLVFSDINPKNTKQEYRATFTDDNLQSISYIFKAKYADEKTAIGMETRIHADHNIYMGTIGHKSEDYGPNYAVMKDNLQVTFYAKKNELDAEGAKLFQLDWSRPLTLNNIQANYESLEYTCEIANSNN